MSLCINQTFPQLVRKIKTCQFPVKVMIETISFCNSRCIICPAQKLSKELPQGMMPWNLYKKIIDECSEYGILNIYSYLANEPLLDEDLVERLRYAKERIPQARIILSTNASLLTQEKTQQLLQYVDSFIFSIFGITDKDYETNMPGLSFQRTMRNIAYFLSIKKERKFKKEIFVRYIVHQEELLKNDSLRHLKKIVNFWKVKGIICKLDLFFTRAGNVSSLAGKAETINIKYNSRLGCWFHNSPLNFIHIIFNGDVILCCMDCRREVVLGNVREKTIYEIWNSKLYNEIRDKIYLGKNRKNSSNLLCSRCINPYLNV